MAGLSHAVLVIEAELRSGTLITSRLATEYNRDVFAVPGPIHSPTARGPHLLIKKGAALIESSEDIIQALHLEQHKTPQATPLPSLAPDERLVVSLLTTPLPRDELMRQLGKPVHEANVLLSSLELRGIIEERLGCVHLVH
jgi:DNA processing protein